MIDLHTHSLYSDGELLPSELLRRVEVMGYRYVAITDHADASNFDLVLERLRRAALALNPVCNTVLLPGVEFTHVPPSQIAPLVSEARALGAAIIVVHGETLAEPVAPGTNRAALEADIDILAHPGLISREEVELARQRGVLLELSARPGHSLANGHVAALAREMGAGLILNTDSHGPRDFITRERAYQLGQGAGLSLTECDQMLANAEALARRAANSL
ncbi:MAG: histidinol phosphate phosphatase domain-containing protein [Deltaproteobacteria bacterium]|nr:histidinol phosphate phosphatase domain-containing protein [Deltaproteobacteria bacterium]MBW1953084.1 histidinol phosphate phosphatase domain-containing protein [Deltaproteobacteria bacterium]MBW1987181.1 histidinol phosphate phosphatase domain-containing protein [Deltaproteobacteria bacterium]MBW2135043.1 histidinol phosphate phosphatase domain-containing protein [Deltaproteobacteria bacterium]